MIADPPVVLCVDDDPDVLETLQILLEAEGATFVGASTAEAALHRVVETSPDLLFVDLMMEEVDAGTNLVKELKLRGDDAPIYLLSSVGDSLQMQLDVSTLGLRGVLQKPLRRELLHGLLRSVLPEHFGD